MFSFFRKFTTSTETTAATAVDVKDPTNWLGDEALADAWTRHQVFEGMANTYEDLARTYRDLAQAYHDSVETRLMLNHELKLRVNDDRVNHVGAQPVDKISSDASSQRYPRHSRQPERVAQA